MIKITDEILNKYLDGELDNAAAEQIKSAICNSEELTRKFNALKFVHDKLSAIEENKVSDAFTGRLMKQIVGRSTAPKKQKYFIASVVTFITLLCLIILGFSISAMISTATSVSNSQSVFDLISTLSQGFASTLRQLFSGAGLSIIGSIFSFIILISGYFFFEMQKRSKANLGNGRQL